MRCQQTQHILSEYLDGELSADLYRRVEAHLAQCPECATELESLRRTVGAVQDLPAQRAPEGLSEQVRLRLEQEQQQPTLRRMVSPWSRVGAVAAMFAVVLGVVMFLRLSGPGTQPPRPSGRMVMMEQDRTAEKTTVADAEDISPEPTGLRQRRAESPPAPAGALAEEHEEQVEEVPLRAITEMGAVARREDADGHREPTPPGRTQELRRPAAHQILTVRTEQTLETAWRALRLAEGRGLQRAELVVGEDEQLDLTLQVQGSRYESFLNGLVGAVREEKKLRNAALVAADRYFQRLEQRFAREDRRLPPYVAGEESERIALRGARADAPAQAAEEAPKDPPSVDQEREVMDGFEDARRDGPERRELHPPGEVILRIRMLPPSPVPEAERNEPSR